MDRIAVGSFLYNCFYMAAMGFVVSILPLYAVDLGADIATIGPVWTIAFLSSFVMALFWGSVSDRSGRRMLHVIIGTAVLSVICILYTFARDIYHIGVIMVLGEMLGSSQAFPIFMAFISELSKLKKRGISMGIFWMGGSVGWALSVSAAGFIAEEIGIKKGFYLSSILFIMSIIAAEKFLGGELGENQTIRRQIGFMEAIKEFRKFGSAFTIFLLASVCFFIGDSVKISYVLMFFEKELKLNRTLATLILSLGTWAEIPLLPLLGALSDRVGRKPLLLSGLFTFFIFNLLMSVSQNYIHAMLTMLLFGVIWGAFTSAGSAFIGDIIEEQNRGKAMSLYNSAASIANIIAPTIMSLAIIKTSFRTAFTMIAIIVLVGFLLVLFGVAPSRLEHSS